MSTDRFAPLTSDKHKLSKIETLRLARNYIVLLRSILATKSPVLEPSTVVSLLTPGLSQTTGNAIQSLVGFTSVQPQSLTSRKENSLHHSPALHYTLNDLLSQLLHRHSKEQELDISNVQSPVREQHQDLEALLMDGMSLNLPAIDQWDDSFEMPDDFN